LCVLSTFGVGRTFGAKSLRTLGAEARLLSARRTLGAKPSQVLFWSVVWVVSEPKFGLGLAHVGVE
jgi:hypothetical protein